MCMQKELLLIIPAYNEQDSILAVVKQINEHYSSFDYIIINDGSTDNTSKICHDNHLNIIDLPINLGLAGAFETGLKYAYKNNYKYAIQFDADGQHRPEYIEAMHNKITEGYDIVIGSRFVTKKKPLSLRMLGSRMISFAIYLTTHYRIKDATSGMRMLNRKMIKEFAFNLNHGPEPDTISYLLRHNAKIAEVQIEMDERTTGVSYLNFTRSIGYMIRMLTSILIIQNFRK